MLYGIGVVDIVSPAVAALPECYSQSLSDCINKGTGLPKAQCDVIRAPYSASVDDKTTARMDDAVNALPICEGPSIIPYVGAAFAAGVLLTVMVIKR